MIIFTGSRGIADGQADSRKALKYAALRRDDGNGDRRPGGPGLVAARVVIAAEAATGD